MTGTIKVLIKTDKAGPGGQWRAGQVYDIEAFEANKLVRRGHAVRVDDEVETAATRTNKPPARKKAAKKTRKKKES